MVRTCEISVYEHVRRQRARCIVAAVAVALLAVVLPVCSLAARANGVNPPAVTPRSGTPPPSAVPLPVGANAQALVTRYPAGTAFEIDTGVHSAFSVVPKSQDTFYGAPGAILDGLGVAPSAFRERRSSPAIGVAVIGASATSPLVIRDYGSAAAAQVGAIQPLPGNRLPIDSAWWLQWLDVQKNAARGVSLSTGMRIVDCSILDNGRLGIGGGGADIVIEGSTVSDNGVGVVRAGFEAGGIKTVGDDVTIVDNHIAGNGAPGIWTDDDSTEDVIRNNAISDNTVGIEIEISANTMVSQNAISDNTEQAVLVVASSGIDVSNNRLNDNRAGILVGGAHRTGPNGVHLHDVAVRSNQVANSGVTGLHQPVPASVDVSFDRDHFVGGRFQWLGQSVTFSQWQAAGQERRGTWVP